MKEASAVAEEACVHGFPMIVAYKAVYDGDITAHERPMLGLYVEP